MLGDGYQDAMKAVEEYCQKRASRVLIKAPNGDTTHFNIRIQLHEWHSQSREAVTPCFPSLPQLHPTHNLMHWTPEAAASHEQSEREPLKPQELKEWMSEQER
jgi:hypothetical protein